MNVAKLMETPEGQRKVEALVAEKIFKWKWATFCGHSFLLAPHEYEQLRFIGAIGWQEGKLKEFSEVDEHFYDSARRPPCHYQRFKAYLTDPAAANEILTWLVNQGNIVDIKVVHGLCEVVIKLFGTRKTKGYGRTWMSALCDAVLQLPEERP